MVNFYDEDDDLDLGADEYDDKEEEPEDAYDFIITLLGNGGIIVSDPESIGGNTLRHQMGGSQIY